MLILRSWVNSTFEGDYLPQSDLLDPTPLDYTTIPSNTTIISRQMRSLSSAVKSDSETSITIRAIVDVATAAERFKLAGLNFDTDLLARDLEIFRVIGPVNQSI